MTLVMLGWSVYIDDVLAETVALQHSFVGYKLHDLLLSDIFFVHTI